MPKSSGSAPAPAQTRSPSSSSTSASSSSAGAAPAAAPAPKARKLSYKEQRELDELPAKIQALEAEQAQLNTRMADPDAYKKEASNIPVMQARLEAIDEALLGLLERWETLGNR